MKHTIRNSLKWLGGIALAVVWFLFAESWLILIVKLCGFWGGTAVLTVITLILSWIVIYLSSRAGNVGRFRDWLNAKEAELSGKAKAAARGGKVLVVANTALFLSPMVAALLMLMLGARRNTAYFYSIFSCLFCAVAWSGFYSGIFWGIHKMIVR